MKAAVLAAPRPCVVSADGCCCRVSVVAVCWRCFRPFPTVFTRFRQNYSLFHPEIERIPPKKWRNAAAEGTTVAAGVFELSAAPCASATPHVAFSHHCALI